MSVHFSTSLAARAALGGRPHLRPPSPGRSLVRSNASAAGGSGSDSYLDMWKKVTKREQEAQELLRRIASEQPPSPASLQAKTDRFYQLLQVPEEERDRVQRLHVIDRATAALAAYHAFMKESPYSAARPPSSPAVSVPREEPADQRGLQQGDALPYQSDTAQNEAPGPDFWSWSPPSGSERDSNLASTDPIPAKRKISVSNSFNLLKEKERPMDALAIPFESTSSEGIHSPPLPPLQSFVEMQTEIDLDTAVAEEEKKLDDQFSTHAAEAAEALGKSTEASGYGTNPDESRWWRETGIETRPDGVVCKWTLIRGVSADETVEWEDKYWEAADQFGFKELGSQKSGRDASGNVWREYWKESMWQDLTSGLFHMEKTADKWGKNQKGEEWHEKWFEHYDSSRQAEKWAHKWCSIDPNTPLEAGHAHVWHERWGEKFDGNGGSVKYTDKWAERLEGDGWSKWGDKWDEHFDPNGHGVKQGETWWQGKHGDRWNRTWGEQHNGSGWVHKYGKSSSGEHWDTHVQEDTWYERHPHFGFEHCYEHSVQLRAVCPPSSINEP